MDNKVLNTIKNNLNNLAATVLRLELQNSRLMRLIFSVAEKGEVPFNMTAEFYKTVLDEKMLMLELRKAHLAKLTEISSPEVIIDDIKEDIKILEKSIQQLEVSGEQEFNDLLKELIGGRTEELCLSICTDFVNTPYNNNPEINKKEMLSKL